MSATFLQKIGVEYPIVQAPMFGVTTPEMVAAASRAGCLGSAALGDSGPDSCVEVIRKCKRLTDDVFSANIFANEVPPITPELREKYDGTKSFLYRLCEKLQLDVRLPEIDDIKPKGYREQLDAILSEHVRILSFTFGNLDKDSIERLKSAGVVLIGSCTSEEEARQLIVSDIDVICVQGIEAGGHRGSFDDANLPQVGGFSLLQNVRQMTDLPLIYAGGIANKNGIEALRTLGANGFQVGTLLLYSQESALTEAEKRHLSKASERDIVLIRSFSGRYARGLKNDFVELFENSDHILPYPYQNKLTGPFRKAAREAELTQYVNLWTGQTFGNFDFRSTEIILNDLKML